MDEGDGSEIQHGHAAVADAPHAESCLDVAVNVREVKALFVSEAGVERRVETVAVEERLDVRVDGAYWASFAVSPSCLKDFVYGALLSAGLVQRAADVASVVVRREDGVLVARVERTEAAGRGALAGCEAGEGPAAVPHAASEAVFPGARSSRASEVVAQDRGRHGENGCRGTGDSAGAPKLRPEAVFAMSRSLLAQQGMHQATGATHAAVFAGLDGKALFMREDVGRHNAVDKLIGALMCAGVDPSAGFVYLSSRCALELVAKCARFGVRIVATVSAPTSAVLDFAQAKGMTLCAFAREGRFTVYTHPERLDVPGIPARP